MKVGDLIRSYKTKQLGLIVEVFDSTSRKTRKDRYGNTFPPLIPIKVIFTGTGTVQCLMNTQVEVLSYEAG